MAEDADDIDAEHKAQPSVKVGQHFRLSRAAFSVEALGSKNNTWTIATFLVMIH